MTFETLIALSETRKDVRRLLKYVEPPSTREGCAIWSGSCYRDGYGRIWWHGKARRVTRIVAALTLGDLDPSMLVCHTCDNRLCINPAHLFLGDNRSNLIDCRKKGRLPIAKLNEASAGEIRRLYACGTPIKDLAKNFCVSPHTITCVVNRRTWRAA